MKIKCKYDNCDLDATWIRVNENFGYCDDHLAFYVLMKGIFHLSQLKKIDEDSKHG